MSLTYDQVAAWRLARHHLLETGPMVDVASALAGVHAQVMSSAELALWLRSGEKHVQTALWQERTLVKTWAMRGTLHLLPAAEWALWSAALATRESLWRQPAWLRAYGTTESEMEALIEVVAGALDTEPRTREELAELVPAAHRERLLSGWGSFLKPVAFRGLLCFGPNRGRNVTFVRPAAWLGPAARLDPQEALREVARRYVWTYGPARPEHFADWWGMRGSGIRRLFQSLELEEVAFDGTTAWALPGQADEIARQEPVRGTTLLGGFDPLVVGWRPRDEFVPDGFLPRVSRTAGWISPVVLVNGRVAGVWEPKKRGKKVEIVVEPFGRLNRRRVEAAARRLADFFDAPVEVAFTRTIRP